MFILILYFLESMIVYIWWNSIIKPEMPRKGTIKKIISVLMPKKFFIKYNIVKDGNSKKHYVLKTLKTLVGKYDFIYILFLLSFGPIVMNICIIGNENIIFKFLVVISFLSILLKSLYTIASDLKKTLFELSHNMENLNFSTVSDENKFTKFIQIYKRKTFLWIGISVLLICIVVLFLEKSVKWFQKFDAPVQGLFFSLIIICIWVTDSVIPRKKKRSNYQKKNKVVEVKNSFYLESVKQSIYDMCDGMKIKDLIVEIEESEYKNAYAIVQKYETPTIIITNSLCEKIMAMSSNIDEYSCYIKLILSHELVHIKFNDPIKITNRVKVSCGLYLIIMFLLMLFPLLVGNYFLNPLFFLELANFCSTTSFYWDNL